MEQNDIYSIFDVGGLLSKKFSSYEFRDGQLDMATLVAKAYEDNAIAAIEAGTGIGKSFAYLATALLWAKEHPQERTVIATSTINLQKQLYEKDIVQLCDVLGESPPVALVVGRSNYLCLHRLQERAEDAPLLVQDPLSALGLLVSWSAETESGLRSDFIGKLQSELWLDVCADIDLCLGYRCPYIRECFFMKARKRALEAKILISNHHLLFSDARMRMIEGSDYSVEAVLPPFQRLVIDEAHNIEKNATDYFTITYSGADIRKTLARITRKKYGTVHMIELLSTCAPTSVDSDLILQEITHLVEAMGYVDTYLVAFMQRTRMMNLLVSCAMHEQLDDFVSLSLRVIGHAKELVSRTKRFLASLSVPDEFESVARELEVHVTRIGSHVEALQLFIDFTHWSTDVHWFETLNNTRDGKSIAVHISPLSIAQSLQEHLFEKLDTVVCTSATLDLQDNFSYWGSRIGLPLPSYRPYYTAVHPSPFDFEHNLLLLTPSDAPIFTEQNPQEFFSYCHHIIKDAILSSTGGALVLFTSYAMLTETAQMIEGELLKHGITLLKQGEADRFYILRRFISDTDSVLFATDSFWEGIDAPGDTLRLVILVKLPFRVPHDPIFRARQEYLDSQGGSGFFQLALPEATMKLKQGFGRLLRNGQDRGIVLILDSRIVQKRYGSWMLRALPQSFHQQTSSSLIPEKIESFLYS